MSYLLIFVTTFLVGQNKHLNIGLQNSGVCLGNSKKHNGVRINFWDKNVSSYNGMNLSVYSSARKSNGLGIGILISKDSLSNGVRIGGIGVGGDYINGIAIGGLGVGALYKFNGLGISGFVMGADTMNGFFISVFGTTNWSTRPIAIVNGVSIGTIGVITKELNGVAIGFMNRADKQKGVTIGFAENSSQKCTGVQIGISNRTKTLFGLQIGLWNVVENKKFLKRTPLINFCFKRRSR